MINWTWLYGLNFNAKDNAIHLGRHCPVDQWLRVQRTHCSFFSFFLLASSPTNPIERGSICNIGISHRRRSNAMPRAGGFQLANLVLAGT